jgi:heme/copper-type cytochrome/quinol oxidase subunit 2
MGTVITLIVIYLTIVFLTRKWIQNAYSEGGVWEWLKPLEVDVFVTILPVINLIILLIFMIGEGSWNGKEPKKKIRPFAKRFFNIK